MVLNFHPSLGIVYGLCGWYLLTITVKNYNTATKHYNGTTDVRPKITTIDDLDIEYTKIRKATEQDLIINYTPESNTFSDFKKTLFDFKRSALRAFGSPEKKTQIIRLKNFDTEALKG